MSAPFCFVELAALFCEVGADENVGAPVRFLRKDGGGQKCPRSNVPETNLPHEGCREKADLAPCRSGNSPAGYSVSTIPLLSESRAVESKLKERATQTGIIVTIPHTDASSIFKKAEWSADIFVRHRAHSHKRSADIFVRHRAHSCESKPKQADKNVPCHQDLIPERIPAKPGQAFVPQGSPWQS